MKYDVNYSLIPTHMRYGVEMYVEKGQRPGAFLVAILENNLIESVARADSTNRDHIIEWAKFLYTEMPSRSWGSKEKVEAWIKARKEEAE
ncbi:MAG: hypothetical protein KAT69_04740 [Candidatus Aminicenantes bacterium]|nr:hypothetical protein [Candidatus Aminicenantes bacterium]